MNIYFVCTGNTCRSPMAAAILKHMQTPNVEIRSAGIYAQNGSAMSQNAQYVLGQKNITHNHLSTAFNAQDAKWADIILTMTESHKAMILRVSEHAQHKTYTLNEYVGLSGDIQDPYGGDVFIYEQTYEQLYKVIEKLVEKIRTEDVPQYGKE